MAEQYDGEGNLQNQVRLIQEQIVDNGQITPEFIGNNERLIYDVATNPNPLTPTAVFKALAHQSLKMDKNKESENFNLTLFKELCKSQNPNCDETIIDKLCSSPWDFRGKLAGMWHVYALDNHGDAPHFFKHTPEFQNFVIILKSLFSTSNQFAKWKDKTGNHLFLQFLNGNFFKDLESKANKEKVEELLVVLAKNSAIHTPDLVARLIELSKKFKAVEGFLFDTANESVSLKYDTKRSAISKQQQFMRSSNYISVHFEGPQSWAYHSTEKSKITSQVFGEAESSSEIAIKPQEIFNLADTFKNLLEALKYYQTQTGQYRAVNISALRLKLQDNSFENLIDISKETSVTRLLVDIASYIEKLNLFQKKVTYKGLIQEFEDFVNNFRFDLIENAGIDGRAYQLSCVYTKTFKSTDLNFDNLPLDLTRNGFDKYLVQHKILIQNHIQQGQNPKELVDGLVEIQNILKQLKAKITKIPIVELTPEQIQDKQFLDEGYQEIESLFRVFPDLTANELFMKLCPSEEVPDIVDEFDWLLGYIEKERLLQMDKDITEVAEANLAEYKALSKVLNSIFAPDQSVELTLIEGNFCDNLKLLWKKVQNIQAVYNGLKADKNTLDQSQKRYSIFYKQFSKILLEELIKVYQEIAYVSPNEKLGRIASTKVQFIGGYLSSFL